MFSQQVGKIVGLAFGAVLSASNAVGAIPVPTPDLPVATPSVPTETPDLPDHPYHRGSGRNGLPENPQLTCDRPEDTRPGCG